MKAGGKQDGDFRELSGSLASAFRLGFIVVSFLLFYYTDLAEAGTTSATYAEFDIFRVQKISAGHSRCSAPTAWNVPPFTNFFQTSS